MNKHYALMRDVIIAHHPGFVGNKELCKFGLDRAEIFNVEKLVEESMAALGPYNLVSGAHFDFTDGSDCKTSSIYTTSTSTTDVSYRGEISGVQTASGNLKHGALRCVIYNPHRDETLYYFLPYDFWINSVTRHPTTGVGKIKYTYNSSRDSIAKFSGLRLSTFAELVMRSK